MTMQKSEKPDAALFYGSIDSVGFRRRIRFFELERPFLIFNMLFCFFIFNL